jgi:hypothetical protein
VRQVPLSNPTRTADDASVYEARAFSVPSDQVCKLHSHQAQRFVPGTNERFSGDAEIFQATQRIVVVMADEDQHRMGDGRGIQTSSSISTEQTVAAWAAVLLGAVFMAAGGVVMLLSLS